MRQQWLAESDYASLRQCLAGNEITEVTGIVNGTTNYILTKMFELGMSFEEALAKATELGYAEADPTADIEGLDAGRKVANYGYFRISQQGRI